MKLQKLPYRLTVAKYKEIPQSLSGFYSLSSFGEEISLLCESDRLPAGAIAMEEGWRAFRVAGTLDFSLVGILSSLTAVLAEHKIPVFALSTYDTDYLLVKAAVFDAAAEAFHAAGYQVE